MSKYFLGYFFLFVSLPILAVFKWDSKQNGCTFPANSLPQFRHGTYILCKCEHWLLERMFWKRRQSILLTPSTNRLPHHPYNYMQSNIFISCWLIECEVECGKSQQIKTLSPIFYVLHIHHHRQLDKEKIKRRQRPRYMDDNNNNRWYYCS